jgi:hypothetical protein
MYNVSRETLGASGPDLGGAPLLAHFEKWAFPMLRKKPTPSTAEKPTSQTREVGHPSSINLN